MPPTSPTSPLTPAPPARTAGAPRCRCCRTTWPASPRAACRRAPPGRRLSCLRQFHLQPAPRRGARQRSVPASRPPAPAAGAAAGALAQARSSGCWRSARPAVRCRRAASRRRAPRSRSCMRPACASPRCCRCAPRRWPARRRCLLVRGKGGRERVVPLSEPARIAVADMLAARARRGAAIALAVRRPQRGASADPAGLRPGSWPRPGAPPENRCRDAVAACAAALLRQPHAGARRRPALACRCCSDTRTSQPPRSTRTCWPSACSAWCRRTIRWHRGRVAVCGQRPGPEARPEARPEGAEEGGEKGLAACPTVLKPGQCASFLISKNPSPSSRTRSTSSAGCPRHDGINIADEVAPAQRQGRQAAPLNLCKADALAEGAGRPACAASARAGLHRRPDHRIPAARRRSQLRRGPRHRRRAGPLRGAGGGGDRHRARRRPRHQAAP